MIRNICEKVYVLRINNSHDVAIWVRVMVIVPVSDTPDKLREHPTHVQYVTTDMLQIIQMCKNKTPHLGQIEMLYSTLLVVNIMPYVL